MLTHIVVWKYKEGTSDEIREEHRNKLKDLPNVITEIESFKVGADILQLDRSYDTGLVAVFANKEALDAYTVHKDHQAVAKMGKEIAEHAVSVDFVD